MIGEQFPSFRNSGPPLVIFAPVALPRFYPGFRVRVFLQFSTAISLFPFLFELEKPFCTGMTL